MTDVIQTVTLTCGHGQTYRIGRVVAESGFARPGVAWTCSTCDPERHTRRPVASVVNLSAPTS